MNKVVFILNGVSFNTNDAKQNHKDADIYWRNEEIYDTPSLQLAAGENAKWWEVALILEGGNRITLFKKSNELLLDYDDGFALHTPEGMSATEASAVPDALTWLGCPKKLLDNKSDEHGISVTPINQDSKNYDAYKKHRNSCLS